MAQYQTFPDAPGDSRTMEKLRALKLPELAGRRFLDVGCNEGFFCGFAKFLKAERAVGIDHSQLFIERARQRFPDCEFNQQGWEKLPNGPFDVILLASALHYAEDQAGLLNRLAGLLSQNGVLVVELGIASSPDNAWVEVERGIDRRAFPTMAKLREVLADYAWKWMGRSVSQDGDPVARHVIHVSRRRPIAYLLMQPPAYGKTSIASRLFAPIDMPVVSGDQQIALVAQGKVTAPGSLRRAIKLGYSPYRIDETIQRIFDSGAGEELVKMWLATAGTGDFALDAYVPVEYQALVESALVQQGYLPVQLRWERVGPKLMTEEMIDGLAEAFQASMASDASRHALRDRSEPKRSARGFVDALSFEAGCLIIRGWALDDNAGLPRCLGVRVNGQTQMTTDVTVQVRPDVQRALQLSHARVGYQVAVAVAGINGLEDIGPGFAVFIPSVGDIRLAARVTKLLAANAKQGGAK
jgi:SAM-dependent methyltransferase